MNIRIVLTVLVALPALLVSSRQASAQEPPPARAGLIEQTAKDGSWPLAGLVDARLGLGMIGEDLFVTIRAGTALQWGKLGLGVQVPLRLRVWDREPEGGGIIREEDWDEVSDWTRVLRFVTWGKPSDWLYLRLGVLQGTTLGHGTIVDRYYNVIDLDHYQTGFEVRVDATEFGVPVGVQTFIDNLVDPELWALRAYVRPFGFVPDSPKVLNDIQVGMTLATDFAAPNRHVADKTSGHRVLSPDGDIVVDTSTAFLWGLDLGWELHPFESWALTPYLDVNVLGATGGAGFHLGILQSFDIAGVVTLGTRLEYRALDGDYAPSYINSWYEVERLDFIGGKTKLQYLLDEERAGRDDTRHGWHLSLNVNILKKVTVAAMFEDYQGPDNSNLMIRLVLPYIAGFKLGVYYAKRNFDAASDAFTLDNALLVSELKWQFWGPMFAFARYTRQWRVNKDTAELDKRAPNSDYGHYETINDWEAGVGAEFAF